MRLFTAIIILAVISVNPSYGQHFDSEKMKRFVEQLYNYMHSKSVPPGDNLDARPLLQSAVQINDFHVKIVDGIQIAEVNLNLYTTWMVTEAKLINSEIDFGTLLLDKKRAWYPDLILENSRQITELSPSRLELQIDMEPTASETNLNPDSLPSVQPNPTSYNDRRRKLVAHELPYFSYTQNLNVEVLCSGSRLVDQIGTVNCPLIIEQGGNQAFLTELKWRENNECLYGDRVKDKELVHLSTAKKFLKSIHKYSTQQGLVINICVSNTSKVFYFILVNIIQSGLSVLLLWILPLGTMNSFMLQILLLFSQILIYLILNTSSNLHQLTNFLNNYSFYLSVICNMLITLLTITAYYRASKILRKKMAQNNRKLLQQPSYPCNGNQLASGNGTNECVLCTSTINPQMGGTNGSTGGNNGLNYNSTYNHVSPIGLGSPNSRIMESRNSPGPLSLLQNGLMAGKLESNYTDGYFLSGSSESGNGTGPLMNGSSQAVQQNQNGHCGCLHRNMPVFSNEGSDLGSGSKLIQNSDNLRSVSAFNMISPNCWLITMRIVLSLVYPLTLIIFWITIFVQSESPMECQGISTCKTKL